MIVAERLLNLEGTWAMRRVIRHADGTVARFSGTADWQPDGVGFICSEDGILTVGTETPVSAMRKTFWRTQGDVIAITFADGRPFHHLPQGSRVAARHDCPPDDYRLLYDFSAWPKWSVRWRVRGPRKDYRALTRYQREGAPDLDTDTVAEPFVITSTAD